MMELLLRFYDILSLTQPGEQYRPSFLAASYLPRSVSGVRDSFASSGLNDWLFWLILLLPLVLLTMVVIRQWRKMSLKSMSPFEGSPRTLFNELLEQLELSTEDKKLLIEMTRAARLKHPSLCMLSPAMLDRTRQLWQQEMGPRRIPREKFNRIDQIAVQLYDHHSVKNATEVLATHNSQATSE